MASNEKLLQEIRENHDTAVSDWADIRKQGATDMRYRAGDPWPKDEREARVLAKRLCLTFDELGQYCNQAINTVRQNKRAIRVVPSGNGATDQTAEKRAAIIRGIEYKSKATAAYITAFEGSIERSYGYVKLGIQYEGPKSFNRELIVQPVPNPEVILLDMDAKQADWSDMGYAFEIDSYRTSRFSERWKNAETKSFGSEHMKVAPAWIKDGRVQVAKYWKVTKTTRDLVIFEDSSVAFLDEIEGARLQAAQERRVGQDTAMCVLPNGDVHQVETRRTEDPKVCEYITNGIEILEETPWPGRRIPIFPCFGKSLYVPDEGGSCKLTLLSLVRLARDPYLSYCFIRTCEGEVAGQVPKAIYMGYEGQFETSTDWPNINRVTTAYAEVKAKTTATGDMILPLPTRQNWEPAIQGLEMMAESSKRAIQSAMGMGSVTVGRQDPSVRSGRAIDALNAQADTGNYHFTDALDNMIEGVGREMDACMATVYDTDREVGGRDRKDEYEKMRINGPPDEKGESFRTDVGDHDVTISTGPSNDSQRDEVNDFAATVVQMENAPPKAIAIAIKLRNLGPLGDELAECWDPQPKEGEAQVPPEIQQKLAESGQMITALTETVKELKNQIDFKQAEIESREKIALAQDQTKKEIALAQINQQAGQAVLMADLAATKHRIDLIDAAETQRATQEHEASQQRAGEEHQASQQQQAQQHAQMEAAEQRKADAEAAAAAPVKAA